MAKDSETTRKALAVVLAWLGAWAAFALLGLAAFSIASDQLAFGIAVAVAAVALGAWAAPVLGREIAAIFADRRAHRAALAPRSRIPCPCCGFPTLVRAGDGEPCAVCEWPNDDAPSELDPAPTVKEARENFKRYGSVYAPNCRPAWAPGPPSAEELARRRHLASAYRAARMGQTLPPAGVRQEEERLKELEFRDVPPE